MHIRNFQKIRRQRILKIIHVLKIFLYLFGSLPNVHNGQSCGDWNVGPRSFFGSPMRLHLPLLSQIYWQGAGQEAEQPRHKPVPLWDASTWRYRTSQLSHGTGSKHLVFILKLKGDRGKNTDTCPTVAPALPVWHWLLNLVGPGSVQKGQGN